MLQVVDLHAYYSKSHILQGVNLDVAEGEIVSLLGRNGVGRSTTCKAVMGEVQSMGRVVFKGQNIVGMKPHQIAQTGIGYVPEHRDIFPTLTVRQNMELGMKKAGREGRWKMKDLFEMFPQLGRRAETLGAVLSVGEQQMLTMCRCLMGDPDLVMIDEPTEGLAPKVVEQVTMLLGEMASKGLSVLLVEQKLSIALDVSHRVYVMGHGRVVFDGRPAELRECTNVREAWLGA